MNQRRQLVSSGSPFEATFGLSRAVCVGDRVWVAGAAPIGDDGATVGIGDPSAQARRCLAIIGSALGRVGASLAVIGSGGE